MGYNQLLAFAAKRGLSVYEVDFESRSKGLIKGGIIGIDRGMDTAQKTCALAEEIGHDCMSVGDIIDQSKIVNRKRERLGQIGRAACRERVL